MSTIPEVYQGAQSPEAYVLDLTPDAGVPVDLETVETAVLLVRRDDGSIVEWPASLSNQTPTTLTLTHEFSLGDSDTRGDVDIPGSYVVRAILTLAGSGVVRSDPRRLRVKGTFEV